MPDPRKVVSDEELSQCVTKIVEMYLKSPQHRLVVGVAGRPGSGKSTVVDVLAAAVRAQLRVASTGPRDQSPDAVATMPMDGYHLYRKTLHAMPNREEAVARRGAEWTFDPRKLCRDLHAIRLPSADAGQPGAPLYDDVLVPSFDHGVGDPVERDIRIAGAASIIIAEGNYLLYRGTPAWAEVNRCFDLTIFLACPTSVCTRRICRRHMAAWNISEEAAMKRATGSDSLNGDLVDGTRRNADIVIHSLEATPSRL